jgi:hypothetical protein
MLRTDLKPPEISEPVAESQRYWYMFKGWLGDRRAGVGQKGVIRGETTVSPSGPESQLDTPGPIRCSSDRFDARGPRGVSDSVVRLHSARPDS